VSPTNKANADCDMGCSLVVQSGHGVLGVVNCDRVGGASRREARLRYCQTSENFLGNPPM
jgi:hypothetical protein